jgi:prepilin-type N-terminal cleavage/methylation domain-containing protein
MNLTPTQAKRKNGFTLIELLVAATIIAVLTTIGVVSFTSTNQRARNGKRKADMEQLRAALELYKSDDSAGAGRYPAGSSYTATTNTLKTAKYLSDPLPQDPKNVSPYVYYYSAPAAQTTFCICAALEGVTQGNSPDTTCASIGPAGTYYCLVNP